MAAQSRSRIHAKHTRSALQGGQAVPMPRGGSSGTLHVMLEPAADLAAAQVALERWQAKSLTIKPNARNGGVAAVRRLRDGR